MMVYILYVLACDLQAHYVPLLIQSYIHHEVKETPDCFVISADIHSLPCTRIRKKALTTMGRIVFWGCVLGLCSGAVCWGCVLYIDHKFFQTSLILPSQKKKELSRREERKCLATTTPNCTLTLP